MLRSVSIASRADAELSAAERLSLGDESRREATGTSTGAAGLRAWTMGLCARGAVGRVVFTEFVGRTTQVVARMPSTAAAAAADQPVTCVRERPQVAAGRRDSWIC